MAWNTGPAWGFTAMRSCGRAISKYSAVMIEITEAHDAWWPPTFSPSRLGRMWLALWIIHDDSQSSLRSSCFRMCVRSVVARGGSVAAVSIGQSGPVRETADIVQLNAKIDLLQPDAEPHGIEMEQIIWVG